MSSCHFPRVGAGLCARPIAQSPGSWARLGEPLQLLFSPAEGDRGDGDLKKICIGW